MYLIIQGGGGGSKPIYHSLSQGRGLNQEGWNDLIKKIIIIN